MSWRGRNWAVTDLWNSHFSIMAPKIFSSTSENCLGISPPFLFVLKIYQTPKGLSFVLIFTYAILKASLKCKTNFNFCYRYFLFFFPFFPVFQLTIPFYLWQMQDLHSFKWCKNNKEQSISHHQTTSSVWVTHNIKITFSILTLKYKRHSLQHQVQSTWTCSVSKNSVHVPSGLKQFIFRKCHNTTMAGAVSCCDIWKLKSVNTGNFAMPCHTTTSTKAEFCHSFSKTTAWMLQSNVITCQHRSHNST